MTAAEIGTIVWAPFPFVEQARVAMRPALVISRSIPPAGPSLAWVLMITSALREDWPGDVRIPDHRAVGLPAPSKVRSAKIATVELDRTEPAGRAPADVMAAVGRHLAATLGWAAP